MESEVLAKVQAIITKESALSESEVVDLMSKIRKLIEFMAPADRKPFATAKLYCDWCLHTMLDRSKAGEDIVIGIHEKVVQIQGIPDNDLIIKELSKLLSWKELKSELAALFSKSQIKDGLTGDKSRWEAFIKHLLEIIRNSPLKAVSKDAVKRLSAQPLRKEGSYIDKISVGPVPENVRQMLKDKSNILCVTATTNDDIHLVVPLTLEE